MQFLLPPGLLPTDDTARFGSAVWGIESPSPDITQRRIPGIYQVTPEELQVDLEAWDDLVRESIASDHLPEVVDLALLGS